LPVKVSRGRSGTFLAFLVREAGLGFFGLTIGLALLVGVGVLLGLTDGATDDSTEAVGVGLGDGLGGAEKAEPEARTVRPRAAAPATAPIARREGVRARKNSMGEAILRV
jgi:hypothetical protein